MDDEDAAEYEKFEREEPNIPEQKVSLFATLWVTFHIHLIFKKLVNWF